jgi:hypothetical protein
MSKLFLIPVLVAGSLLTAGCATEDEVKHAQTTADQALAAANSAGQRADQAQATAQNALSAAQAAQQSANQALQGVTDLQAMHRKGQRG